MGGGAPEQKAQPVPLLPGMLRAAEPVQPTLASGVPTSSVAPVQTAGQAATTARDEFAPVLKSIGEQYPALTPHLSNAKVQWGEKSSVPGGQLEFYPPWESRNPNPGAITVELYNKEFAKDPAALQSAVAGDLLHHLGGTDPRTGKPVDPQWLAMRDKVIEARSPQNKAIDARAYDQARKEEGDTRSFADWMGQSRADAYVRGYITPDKADEWRKHGVYNARMSNVLDQMKEYLGRSK